MKKGLLIAVAMMVITGAQAQKFPVGIVSAQDTVKGFQFGIISSVAPDGGHGFILSLPQTGVMTKLEQRIFVGCRITSRHVISLAHH